ncbi:GNAT family N-acetyltransferase [Cellulomonas sp. P22]|uniref:GNAT family N-acetyltransferase n=1 Tax=Cellulomonas sp. P22 TaxID=3373189 RepID=UPI0037ACF23D
MTATTSRLRLRPFSESDFAWLHLITANPTVTRYTSWGPNTPADTRAFLDEASRSGRGPDEFTWAVTLPDGTGIGSAGLEVIGRENRRASFGYMLDPGYWRQGYATEVAEQLVAFAQTLGMHRVEATCHPDNAASARVLEKAGLTLEGRLRDHLHVRGAWRDSLLYAVVLRN